MDTLSGSSTVGIIRCGPVVETIEGSPFDDLPAVRTLLTELRPTGGGANASEAIEQAVELAKKGRNPLKQVVLFTDDQLRTWESFEDSPSLQMPEPKAADAVVSEDAADGEEPGESRVHLAVHLANLPDRTVNVSVVGTRVEATVPAVGQPLVIEAELRNHGETTIANADVQLLVDGKPVALESVDVLAPATTTTIRIPYTFESPGECMW